MRRQRPVLLALFCLLALVLWLNRPSTPAPAATTAFTTLDGERLTLAGLQGRPLLVTFWASDCPACLAEIPDLAGLHARYAAAGLTIIAVAMPYDPPNRVQQLARERQLPYRVALDPGAELTAAFGNVRLTPTTFLIDRGGRVVLQTTGRFDAADLAARLAVL